MASIINASTAGAGGVITTADASGVLQLQTAGTTAVTVNTSGSIAVGTSTSNYGTSGQVLTSQGNAAPTWSTPAGGVTSLNGQTGAITSTSLYAIGSYILGRPFNGTNYTVDTTIAGSSLYTVSALGIAYNSGWQAPNLGQVLINTGTWRCVSPASGNGTNLGYAGIWVRIS